MLFEHITVSKGKLATTKKYKNFDIFLRPEALLLHYWQSFNDDALSFLIIRESGFCANLLRPQYFLYNVSYA